MANKCYKERGGMSILGMMAVAVIAILVLSYFNISLKSVVEDPSIPQGFNNLVQSPQTEENVTYITGGVTNIWRKYLQKPLTAFWNNIFIVYIWEPFIDNMQRIHDGKPTDFQLNAPFVPMPSQN